MKSSVNNLVLERGILTSTYKREIKQCICSIGRTSLSRMKNRVNKERSKFYSQTATVLKVSMFALVALLVVI